MPAFLDPTQPLATCTATTCAGCPAGALVHCHSRGRDLARFLAAMLLPSVIGGAGIAHVGSLCPKCGAPMVLRTAQRGPHTGERFWACPNYPQCRAVLPADEP